MVKLSRKETYVLNLTLELLQYNLFDIALTPQLFFLFLYCNNFKNVNKLGLPISYRKTDLLGLS